MPVDKNSKLSIVKCIRFSNIDIELMDRLTKHNVDVPNFIRQSFREKLEEKWNDIMKNNQKNDCPF